MLTYYLILAVLFSGGLASLLLGTRVQALKVASMTVTAGSVLGFIFTLPLFVSGASLQGTIPIPLPAGECSFTVDPLSSLFMLPVFFLSALGGILLPSRMLVLYGDSSQPVQYGRHGFFYCLLVAGMVLVLTASDAVLFVITWEIMSLAPFFLISPNDKDSQERYAAWIYLIAAHLGALPLLYLFAGMSVETGATGFFTFAGHVGWQNAGLFFVLALVGFGLKVGLVPLHVWMPEAYPAAPGHVALLLSGAMINLGLYGFLRILSLLGMGEVWWAYLLMGAGAFSGVAAILLGLAQSDIKRTLAYSSAENMGIIFLALGAGLLAARHQASEAVALLFGGALLHMWNHSLFKSLLFLAANAVGESARSTRIHLLGGLHKRIPFTGGCFAVGSAAIAGIPPLNGFMSEMLIYLGFAFSSQAARGTEDSLVFWAAFFLLGTVAGMAVFAFTRTFGLAFLGAPRSEKVMDAREPDAILKGSMLGLALLCFCTSLAGPWLFRALSPFFQFFSLRLSMPEALSVADESFAETVLYWYAAAGIVMIMVFALVFLMRKKILARNGSDESLTWDCGYRYPTSRMQYTGGSFSHTFAVMLKPLIRARLDVPKIREIFPGKEKATMTTPDWPATMWDRFVFEPVEFVAEYTKNLQFGLVNVYILYIFIALLAALIWALGGA